MNNWLPLFPLKIVVFPGELLNLHIFEERYKQLINDCASAGHSFGIPTHFEKKKLKYGTKMELVDIVNKYPDGRMDIRTKGLEAFFIKEFNKSFVNKLYPAGRVQTIKDDSTADILLTERILKHLQELFQIMDIKKELPTLDREFSSFKIGHLVGFSLQQEYHLLSLASEIERLEFILDHLVNLIPVVEEMEKLKKKAKMNGHFRNIIPPEI